jgi:hypothetical protein
MLSAEVDGNFNAMIWTIHFGYDNYGEVGIRARSSSGAVC